MKRIVIISGTPGTGKTTIARSLSKHYSAVLIDINKEVIEHNFFMNDPERNTRIADIEKLKPYLIQKIKNIQSGYVIIEGHYADIVPNNLVFKVIILRTHPAILKERLRQKKYSKSKLIENLHAEILGVCSYNALENYEPKKIYELDNSDLSEEATLNKVKLIIETDNLEYNVGKIDWLGILEKEGTLSEYFS